MPLCLLILAAPAGAQEEVDRESILRELEKTDQIIAQAREFTAEATAISSHGHLETAIRMQSKAREHFSGRRYGQARALTLDARREALRALDASRAEKKTLESLARMLEQADERALEVAQWVRDCGDEQARRVFEQGLEQLRRARRAQRDLHYAQATRLVTLALSLVERAGRIALGTVSAAAAAETSIERTTALLARVEAALQEFDQAPDQSPALAEARRLLRLAGEHLAEGRARQALRFSLAARQKGMQLLAELRQAPAEQDLREALEDLTALFADLGPEIEASGGSDAERLLAEGRRLLRRARGQLARGHGREALQYMLAAERMLRKAARSVGL